MKVAIQYICTGDYSLFFEKFYHSVKKYLLIGHHVDIVVFSDNHDILSTHRPNVISFYERGEGFPFDSIKRYELVARHQDVFCQYDYIYFVNANAYVNNLIGENIFPPDDKKLVATYHAGYYNVPSDLAAVTTGIRVERYATGVFQGGSSKAYCDVCTRLAEMKNLNKLPHHDETAWNIEVNQREDVHWLLPTFAYPQMYQNLLKHAKIVTTEKHIEFPQLFAKKT